MEVIVAREDNILRITMNRPAKKNALTGAMYKAMQDALELADRDEQIGAVLLTGTGGVFTAGNDIGDFLAGTRDAQGSPAFRFITAIAQCDTPIVAVCQSSPEILLVCRALLEETFPGPLEVEAAFSVTVWSWNRV